MVKYHNRSISVEVDVYLDDFDDEALIDELNDRGYKFADSEQLTCIDRANRLYSVWLTCSESTFKKELENFFQNTITK